MQISSPGSYCSTGEGHADQHPCGALQPAGQVGCNGSRTAAGLAEPHCHSADRHRLPAQTCKQLIAVQRLLCLEVSPPNPLLPSSLNYLAAQRQMKAISSVASKARCEMCQIGSFHKVGSKCRPPVKHTGFADPLASSGLIHPHEFSTICNNVPSGARLANPCSATHTHPMQYTFLARIPVASTFQSAD